MAKWGLATRFDAEAYGPEVGAILALDGAGNRLMPLVARGASPVASAALTRHTAATLFPRSHAALEALAGLWLYFSGFAEAHTIVQDLATPEAAYWHAILHRQEPDAGNSSYWFRQVGRHPIFQRLAESASAIAAAHPKSGFRVAGSWDPHAFVQFCEQARGRPGSADEALALEIQRAEWQLLFDSCARLDA